MKKFFKIKQTALLMAAVSLANVTYAGNNSQTRNFVIKYGSGVRNIQITFDPAYSNRGNTSGLTVINNSSSTSTTISVHSGLDDSSTLASSFHTTYPYKWQTLEMNSAKSAPKKLDFWVEGRMIIDELPVTTESDEYGFSWAHDGKSGNWWIANNAFVNRNLDNDGLTVATYDGNKSIYYCMKANKNSSYSVTISKGTCSPTSLNFMFKYDGINVRNVDFKNYYNPAISAGLLSYESISIHTTAYQTTLTFTSQLNNNNLLADQFNAAYAPDHSLNLNGATTDKASSIDFWAEGDLEINGSKVTQIAGVVHPGFSFAHEYSTRNWWIADNSGTAYISPGNFYMLDLTTEDGNSYCLHGNKGSNYLVTVTLGRCVVPGLSNYDFYMRGTMGYNYIRYKISPQNPDPNKAPNFESTVVTQLAERMVRITVTSVKNNSSSLAKDFAALYSPEANMQVGDGTKQRPTSLDFWISGEVTASRTNPEVPQANKDVFDLELALDSTQNNTWWVGSQYGYRYWEKDLWEWEFIILGTHATITSEKKNPLGEKTNAIRILGISNP